MSRLSETKVGAMVIAAVVALAAVLYFLMGPGRVGKTWPLEIVFKDARGLTGGEPVRMAGVEIGQVKEVSLALNRQASVKVLIKQGVPLYDNYLFTISSGALVPERFVEVQPVAITEEGRPLRADAVVQGMESPGLQELLTAAQGMLTRLEQTAASVNTIVGDPEVVKATKAALEHFEITSRDAAKLMEDLSAVSSEARPSLIKAAQEIALASEHAQEAVSDLAARVQGSSAPEDIAAAVAAAKEAMQNARTTASSLQALLSDPTLQGDIRAGLGNLREISQNLKEASENIREASAQVKEGSPHIKSVLERADNLLADAGQWKERLRPPQVTPKFSFLSSARAGRSFTDANFNISFAGQRTRFLRLGVADIGEQNQVNFQAGRRMGERNLRYGLVRSKLGLGADFPVWNGTWLSLDLLDPNRLRADFTADIPMGGAAGGWGLILGMRDGFGEDFPFVGARFGQ